MKYLLSIIIIISMLILINLRSIKQAYTYYCVTYIKSGYENSSKTIAPDYEEIFNDSEVLRINIKMEANEWTNMQNELDSLLPPPMDGPKRPMGIGQPEFMANQPPVERMNNRPPPPMHNGSNHGPHGNRGKLRKPTWKECTITYKNKRWQHVGIRCKGNSSLMFTNVSERKKFSFKLDFDQFEDEYPKIKNQRFYGFKQLNLNNNFKDGSFMREKVAADLFRAFGIASANTSFCALYIDTGSGLKFFGLYTLVEEVDDSVLKTQFENNTGNLYKPDGQSATFANGIFDKKEMNLKTNKKLANYQDIETLYQTINNKLRINNTKAWENELEHVFDVNIFLKWLAANTIIQNWDSYGTIAHNYYLYNNPENGLLTWIPWDNNEALLEFRVNNTSDFSHDETNKNWPLIRYILDQPEYKKAYNRYLKQFTSEIFYPDKMIGIYTKYQRQLNPYMELEKSMQDHHNNQTDFNASVNQLKQHAISQTSNIKTYLN